MPWVSLKVTMKIALENCLQETPDVTEIQGNYMVSVLTVEKIVDRFERTGEVTRSTGCHMSCSLMRYISLLPCSSQEKS